MCCENCGKKLYKMRNLDSSYSSVYISHIITKGAHPDIMHDPRNHNILCFICHNKWENGARKDMVIYMDNKIVIKEMLSDYCVL